MSDKFKMIGSITTLALTLVLALVGAVGNYLDRGEEKADKVLEVMKVQIEHTERVQKALSEDVGKLQDALLMLGMQSLTAKKDAPVMSSHPPVGRFHSRGLGVGGAGSGSSGAGRGSSGRRPAPPPAEPEEPAEEGADEEAPEEEKKEAKKVVKKKLKLDDMKSAHVQQRPMLPVGL